MDRRPACALRLGPEFSPQAWGWTETGDDEGIVTVVFPTGVGVDRSRFGKCGCQKAFSPQAWGWTVDAYGLAPAIRVFPTGVGVDRASYLGEIKITGFPHRRGGGPRILTPLLRKRKFSPQAWGWTVIQPRQRIVECRFPHRRGGGPLTQVDISFYGWFSPQAWGWTVWRYSHALGHDVFPTGVGVDRLRLALLARRGCFPHRRGDVS